MNQYEQVYIGGPTSSRLRRHTKARAKRAHGGSGGEGVAPLERRLIRKAFERSESRGVRAPPQVRRLIRRQMDTSELIPSTVPIPACEASLQENTEISSTSAGELFRLVAINGGATRSCTLNTYLATYYSTLYRSPLLLLTGPSILVAPTLFELSLFANLVHSL
jgi:hypothetical protein